VCRGGGTELAASLVLLTPWGALLAIAAVVPLAALSLAARRERRGCAALELPAPPPERRLPRALAVAAVPLVLAAAAMQPALRTTTKAHVRTDAQAFFVLDTSRSMQASRTAAGPTRLDRARTEAIAIRDAIPQVPAGVANMTDRVLPNLFPTPDESVFQDTLLHAVGIEQPPPSTVDVVATDLDALGALGTQNFFPPTARKRLVVVLTDGESRPVDTRRLARSLGAGPGVDVILVHVWKQGETVHDGGRPEPGYREDASSGRTLAAIASATGGRVFGEGSAAAAAQAARSALGSGPTVVVGTAVRTRTLAPYVALAALVPLLPLVWPGVVSGLHAGGLRRTTARRPAGARAPRTA
jgi:hypothetical protein